MADSAELMHRVRHSFFELVASLDTHEWDLDSPCPGWRIRDVVAHVTYIAETSAWRSTVDALRFRMNIDRLLDEIARERGNRRPDQLVADLEASLDVRRRPPGISFGQIAVDNYVHGHDIATVTGRKFELDDADVGRLLAAAVVTKPAVNGSRRAKGLQLEATDIDFHWGTGPLVRATAHDHVMALCGRSARLEGPGAETLASRRVLAPRIHHDARARVVGVLRDPDTSDSIGSPTEHGGTNNLRDAR